MRESQIKLEECGVDFIDRPTHHRFDFVLIEVVNSALTRLIGDLEVVSTLILRVKLFDSVREEYDLTEGYLQIV